MLDPFLAFDCAAEDPAEALHQCRTFVEGLRFGYDAPLDAARVCWSGATGFSVELPGELEAQLESSPSATAVENRRALRRPGAPHASLVQLLVERGETVFEVNARWTALGRRLSRSRDKTDRLGR